MTVAIVIIYLVLLIGIGLVAGTQTRSADSFFLADRSFGHWVSAFSSRATGESGWLLLGLTGMGWLVGVSAFWVVLGEVAGVTVSWVLIARPFYRRAKEYDSISIPDYLESHFSDSRHVLRWISAGVLLSMVIAYLAAQLTATGKAFRDFLGIDFVAGAAIGLAVVALYTVSGGLRAVAWSDLVQGTMMLTGLAVVPVVAFAAAGGLGGVTASLREQDPALLDPFGAPGLTLVGVAAAASLAGPGLGFMGAPQVYKRLMAVRNERALVRGSVVAVLFTAITDSGAVLAGMAGRALYSSLPDQEAVLPTLANELFPPFLTALLIAVVLAAIMSTVDSLLLLASETLVHDLYRRVIRPQASDSQVLLLSRILTMVLGLLAFFFAAREVRLVFWFVLFAWAGIAASFCPVIILSVFWRGLTLRGAAAAMVVGFVTTVLWKIYLGSVLYELIPGFVLASVTAFLVSIFDPTPPPSHHLRSEGSDLQ